MPEPLSLYTAAASTAAVAAIAVAAAAGSQLYLG